MSFIDQTQCLLTLLSVFVVSERKVFDLVMSRLYETAHLLILFH